MCTALSIKRHHHYFGRNLDLDRSYGEEVCMMPRNFPLEFRKMGRMDSHFAIIGMATVVNGLPLFYDGANEAGLAMAGLNFPGNAYYAPIVKGKDNIAPFEMIPWILCQCKCVQEAKVLLDKMNLAHIDFSSQLPSAPLHWMIADKDSSIVAEFRRDGLHLHENPYGVLTNNPPFEYHLANLAQYNNLRVDNRDVERKKFDDYTDYCQGLGALGLPGDVSSMSRFARIVFHAQNAVFTEDVSSAVGQFFHLLTSVEMVKGACVTDENTLDFTGYSACVDTDTGRYYYTTYDNHQISCVDMRRFDLNHNEISRFPIAGAETIAYRN